MAILKVARMGHPVLRTPVRPVDPAEILTPRTQQLIDDMLATMREYHGVGLAAPQVHEGLRLFVAAIGSDEHDDREEVPALVLINPEIRPIGSQVIEDWEGCLSIPDLRGKVPRAAEIQVRGYDRHGARLSLRATAFAARVLQHETDHLDGVLFLDRMRSFESLTVLDEYARYWSKEDTPLE
jgi:peptide deformylase